MDNLKYCYNVRSGKHIDILAFAKDIEDNFRIALKSTIETYECLADVQDETFADYLIASAKFEILKELGYIEDEEFVAVKLVLEKIRIEELGKLENVPESAND